MGCGCGGGSSSSTSTSRQRQSSTTGAGVSAYQYEATYTDGTTQRFDTQAEVLAALAHSGGGFRMVPRGS